MAFPDDVLDVGAELLIAGTYTDITSYVRGASGISMQRGRSDWGTEVDPGQCTLTLDNTDGRFSPRNPASPYFGLIGRNTPIRIIVNEGSTHADFLGTAGNKITTPDNAALDITGDIDIRFDFRPDSWNGGTEYELFGKWNTTGNQRSWYITGGSTGVFTLHWSSTGSNDLTAVSTVNGLDSPDLRQSFRITLDVDNGAGGYTVTFYRSDSIDGTWEQFDQIVTTAGTTSIFSSTAVVEIGDLASIAGNPFSGVVFAFQILNGIAGTAVANPDFTAQTDGATSFADAAGRTWTTGGVAVIRTRRIRMWGEVTEWPPRWDVGGFDVTSTIQVSGYFRRLKASQETTLSVLRRVLPAAADLLAYWPMEDEAGATQAASGLPGGKAMSVTGATFADDSSLVSSAPLPVFAVDAALSGVPPTGTSGGWTVAGVFKANALPSSQQELWRVRVKSSGISYVSVFAWSTSIRVEAFDSSDVSLGGATFTDATAAAAFIGQWNQFRIRCTDSGSDVTLIVNWINAAGTGYFVGPTTITSVSPGNVAAFTIRDLHTDYSGLVMGHVGVFDSANTFAYNSVMDGLSGESANTRIARVLDEVGITRFVIDGSVSRGSELLGPQRVQTVFQVLQNAADADGGILYEERRYKAVVYRDRATLENQPVRMTVPYADVMAPLEPTDDTQNVQNDVTVSRVDGSSEQVEQATGPLNVQEAEDDPDGVGRYATSFSLDLDNDTQTGYIAGWKLHIGTWDEARYPIVRVNLARNPELIDDATRVDIGDRIQITDPPAWLPPGTIDLLVQGYKEYMDQNVWTIEYNCTPYGPFVVAVTDTGAARANTAGCELAEDLTTTETGVDVLTTTEPIWVDSATYASDFPFDIVIGGEVMTVTAITGTTTSQTMTVTRSVNGIVKTHSTGDAVSLAVPSYTAL